MRIGKDIAILIILAVLGVATFVGLSSYAFPEALVDVKIDSSEAKELSDRIAVDSGINPDDYTASTIFLSFEDIRLFLEDNVGLEEANRLSQEKIPIWYWHTYYYRELETEKFQTRFTTDGKLIGFLHTLEENAPGESLDQDDAKEIAEDYIRSQGIDLSHYELASSSSEELPNRTDHYFEWKEKGFSIPYGSSEATLRIKVDISGDEVSFFERDSLQLPEEYLKDSAEASSISGVFLVVSGFLVALMFVFIIVVFAQNYSIISKKFAAYAALLIGLMGVIDLFNSYPLLTFFYDVNSSFAVYYTTEILFSLGFVVIGALGIFIVAGAGEALSKQIFPRAVAGLSNIKQRLLSHQFRKDALVGYALAGISLGFVAIYYAIGKQYLGFWTPADVSTVSAFNVVFPFLVPLSISLVAAVSEEFIFRMFAIPFVKKYLKYTWLALLLPAVVWSFAHAGYTIYPFYGRFIELTVAGVIYGIFFLRYGIFSVIISHYVYDAVIISIPLLASSNTFFFASGIAVILLALVPAVWGFFAKGRTETVHTEHRGRAVPESF